MTPTVVYLGGPAYKWDDDIKVFLSPEHALAHYSRIDGEQYYFKDDKLTIANRNGEHMYYLNRMVIIVDL